MISSLFSVTLSARKLNFLPSRNKKKMVVHWFSWCFNARWDKTQIKFVVPHSFC